MSVLSVAGCGKSAVQQTAYVGDGMYEGEPPMCLQHKKESRPSSASLRSLLVHFNNTCDFAVDCLVYNDVSEQEQRVVVLPNRRWSLLVAAGTEERSFDVELNCVWQG